MTKEYWMQNLNLEIGYGRTYEERRFSPLTGINKENVSELGLIWSKDMGTNRALCYPYCS